MPLTVALVQGDLKSMFTYRDHEESKTSKANTSTTSNESAGDSASENYVRVGNSPKVSKKDKKKN